MFLDKNIGSFTFRGKSTIDYVMARADCFTEIAHFEIIETDRLFSDGHSLLSWYVRICKESLNPSENQMTKIRPNWVTDMHVDFCNNLNQEKIHNISSQLNTYLQSQETIDIITHELNVVFQNSAEITFPGRTARKHLSKNNVGNKPWFGQKCHQAKKII